MIPMTIQEIETQLRQIEKYTEDLSTLKGLLLQDEARLRAGLSETPKAHLEALRKHAIERVKMGRSVQFVTPNSGLVSAEPDPCTEKDSWTVYADRWEGNERVDRVLQLLQEATMFGENMD